MSCRHRKRRAFSSPTGGTWNLKKICQSVRPFAHVTWQLKRRSHDNYKSRGGPVPPIFVSSKNPKVQNVKTDRKKCESCTSSSRVQSGQCQPLCCCPLRLWLLREKKKSQKTADWPQLSKYHPPTGERKFRPKSDSGQYFLRIGLRPLAKFTKIKRFKSWKRLEMNQNCTEMDFTLDDDDLGHHKTIKKKRLDGRKWTRGKRMKSQTKQS